MKGQSLTRRASPGRKFTTPGKRAGHASVAAVPPPCGIFILAGGLSRRMGRDKSRLPLGCETMLATIRRSARAANLPTRIIRRDSVPRCGPLGGIYSAMLAANLDRLLFLACDMPFVTTELIQLILTTLGPKYNGVFVQTRGGPGFPILLRRDILPVVRKQIERGDFSLQTLAKEISAKILRLPRKFDPQLRNINTPAEWAFARKLWRHRNLSRP